MAAGDNPFGDEEETTEEEQERELSLSEEFDWRRKFRTDAVSQLEKWASDFDVSKFTMDAFVRGNIDGAVSYIDNLHRRRRRLTDGIGGGAFTAPINAREFQAMWDDGMTFFARKSGLNFDGLGPKTGTSGSGSRKPTAAELRAMFDEDQLTETVNTMWGAYLVEDAPNARSIAQSYINAIVASGGEQKIDFETFILNKIRKTNRHKLVYRNKPEGTDELQYIAPYTQSAMSVIGGGGRAGASATDVAAGGAALGASASAFSDRLARTPEHQQTKGFISGLEQRVRDVKNVLRG